MESGLCWVPCPYVPLKAEKGGTLGQDVNGETDDVTVQLV